MNATQIKVGDELWQGHGRLNGRDVDDSATGYYATKAEALAAARDEWMSWLSPRKREQADVYARKMRVLALTDDGDCIHVTVEAD